MYQVRCARPGYGGANRRSCDSSTAAGTGCGRTVLRRTSSASSTHTTAWVTRASRRRATAPARPRCWSLREVASHTTVPPVRVAAARARLNRSRPSRSTSALSFWSPRAPRAARRSSRLTYALTPGSDPAKVLLPLPEGPHSWISRGNAPSRHRQVAATASSAVRALPSANASRASAQQRSAASASTPATPSRSPDRNNPSGSGPSSPASSAHSADHSTHSRAALSAAAPASACSTPRSAAAASRTSPARRSSSGNGRRSTGYSPTRSATRRAVAIPSGPAASRAPRAARRSPRSAAASTPASRASPVRPAPSRRAVTSATTSSVDAADVPGGSTAGMGGSACAAGPAPTASRSAATSGSEPDRTAHNGARRPSPFGTTCAYIQCVSVCTCPTRTHFATYRPKSARVNPSTVRTT